MQAVHAPFPPERVVLFFAKIKTFAIYIRYMEVFNDKELSIARYAATGMTAQEIAAAMCLSTETVRWYRKRMLRKAEARNFAELIARLKDEKII